MFTTHTLSTDLLDYHKDTKMFIVDSSDLPKDFCPSNTIIDEDLLGKKIWVLNPSTQKGRWFIHNPDTDRIMYPSGDEVMAYLYRGPDGLELHILND